jgi:NADH dehydrogenase [ubiquinone] 1 alpha subcomplex assembly factor 5
VSDPIAIFDAPRHRRQLARAAAGFAEHDFLFREVAERLADRLLDIDRRFATRLDIGARCPVAGGISADICAALRPERGAFAVFDPEFLPIKENALDLVVSNLCLHWANDLPGALLQIRRALTPDGLFLAAIFGGETLKELRECLMAAEIELVGGAGPRIAPFADIRDMGGLLQRAGFALPVTDLDTITVSYENAFRLMADLRGMGESSALVEGPKAVPPRALFPRAAALYHERHGDADGRIPATFQVIFLHGWGPDASQQQPLRPGKAQTRLADALNSLEMPAGEKAKPGC